MSRPQEISSMSARRESERSARVAFYIHSMCGGGAERVFALVSSRLAKRGYSVDLVLNRAEGPHMAFVAPEVRVVSLDCRGTTALFRFLAWMLRERPDFLLTANAHSNLIGAFARVTARGRFLPTVHTIGSKHLWNFRTTRLQGLISQALSPLVYRTADAVGVVSHAVADDIPLTGVRPQKFHVLYNPVDTVLFSPRPVPGEEAATVLPGEDGSPIVLALGRLDRAKNFGLLIEALRHISMHTRLVLLGEGPERGRLEALAHELGVADRVHMPGFVVDPAPWYRRAAVVASTSRYEGFGNTVVEALASGTPVVVAECTGAFREILDDGRFGTIVPQDNPEAMAAALSQAIRDPVPVDGLVERAAAFSLDTVVDRYEAMLRATACTSITTQRGSSQLAPAEQPRP